MNSWEASYFDISESSLLRLAKMGKDVGVELFVMDDGWFGTRDNDTKALGTGVEYEEAAKWCGRTLQEK